jgi:hypothetical protein
MDQSTVTLVVAAILVIALAAAIWFFYDQRRRQQLQKHFGPEYERVVSEEGDQRRAERVLSERESRVKKLDIRPLSDAARDHFVTRWRKVQERFVDDPRGAVSDADALIGEAMETRGYPVGDFEQRAADVSVDHPRVVLDYRTAHEIAEREGEIDTEHLRQAMVHYRSLFDDLVGVTPERAQERVERVEPLDRVKPLDRVERGEPVERVGRVERVERNDEREETHR